MNVVWLMVRMHDLNYLTVLPLLVESSTALYAGEIWGVHPRTLTEQKRLARLHSKYRRQLLKLSHGTCTTSLMLDLRQMSLQDH